MAWNDAVKFPHLPIGERFRFEGDIYRKTGPIAATNEATGQTRMIPRYAKLEMLDDKPASPKPAPLSLRAAFEAYDAETIALLDAHQVSSREKWQAARDALQALLREIKP